MLWWQFLFLTFWNRKNWYRTRMECCLQSHTPFNRISCVIVASTRRPRFALWIHSCECRTSLSRHVLVRGKIMPSILIRAPILIFVCSAVHQRESKMHEMIFQEIFSQYTTNLINRGHFIDQLIFRPELFPIAINGFFYVFPANSYCGQLHLWSFAVAIVIASLAGPQWLLTEEKIPNINYNGTINYNGKDDGVYITKYTKSSLWILCFAQGRYVACKNECRLDSRPSICNASESVAIAAHDIEMRRQQMIQTP